MTATPGGAAAPESPAAAERRELTGRAGVVALGTLASRLLGLGRDLVLAAGFSRAATDAFLVAFTIPNSLRQLLAEGAVQTAVLPVLARTRELEGEDAARRFFAAARGLSLVALLAVSAAGVLLAGPIVELFAPGVPGDVEAQARTVRLTRWLFPYILFMGTAALGAAALNAARRFVVTAFAPALLNVSCIALGATLPGLLSRSGEDPILAMAWGALVGGALQVAVQWPSLHAIGFLGRPRFDLSHPGVREALRRLGPVVLGLGVYLVDVVLARRLLSTLGEGPQTYFGFALRLCDFPQGIFVMAIQTAALPSLSALAARGDREGLAGTYAFGVRLTLFVGVAATGLFLTLSEPIVRMLFERGEFDALATRETARALVAQGAGIWTVAVVRQLVAVYYAVGDTRRPVVVSLLDLAAFVGLALGLRGPLGHVGVGVAVAGSSAVQMLLLWRGLGRHLPDLHLGEIARSAARTLAATVAAALVARPVTAGLVAATGSDAVSRLLPGLGGALSFGLVFLVGARLSGSEELAVVTSALRRRLGR